MSEEQRKALEKAFNKLMKLSPEKLRAEVEKHKDEDISLLLTEAWNTRADEPRCPCGGVIYANTEDWKVPVCYECYEEIREYFKESNNEQT